MKTRKKIKVSKGEKKVSDKQKKKQLKIKFSKVEKNPQTRKNIDITTRKKV